MKQITSICFFIILTVLISGCARNNKSLNEKTDFKKNQRILITTNVGNISEYRKNDGTFFKYSTFRYSAIKSWNVDNYIFNTLRKKLKERGFSNVARLPLSEKMIIEKSAIYTYYSPEYINQSVNKYVNSDDIFIYINNMVLDKRIFRTDTDIETFTNNNLSLNNYDNKVFMTNSFLLFHTVSSIEKIKDKKFKMIDNGNLIIKHGSVKKDIFDNTKEYYSEENIKRLEPAYKKLIDISIDEYLDKYFIK